MYNLLNKTSLNQVGLNVTLSPMAGIKRVRALPSMSNKLDASLKKKRTISFL